MINDAQILADFVTESRDHLAGIENQLLAIEVAGAEADPELVNTVFRAIHSIKGAAGFLGLTVLGQLAHGLESVLNLVRNRQLVADSANVGVLLEGADLLRGMIEDVEHSNHVDVAALLEALQAIANGEPPRQRREELAPIEPEAAVVAPEAATVAPEAATVEPADAAPVLAATPAPHADEPPHAAPPPTEDVTPPAAAPTTRNAPPSPPAATAGSDSSIRVNVTVLDRLMNLAGELVLARNQLLQLTSGPAHRTINSAAARVNQVTTELQETIMQTRLQSVGTVFNRFPRVVRDLSLALGKQCHLTIEGQEVEVDKSILEAIADPLTHLIRNAVDHGIELPAARAAAGKPAVGTVALSAFHQAGKVNIVIADDGRGIDVNRIKEIAVAKGLIQPDQARTLNDREALQIIFRPGFSTAEKVTEVSGRGVGMDVVKTNIEKLGGSVSVETQPGKGSRFHVTLPLTLAIIPSLIVRCDQRRFAVPQTSIRELVRLRGCDAGQRIERIKRAEVFRLRGALLPLVRLSAALGLESGQPEATNVRGKNILVVEAGTLRYGLVVDGLHDSEEIVVKPLGRHLKGSPCLAGATILGDGQVALILDVPGIAAHCRLAVPDDDQVADASTREAAAGDDSQALLLFSNAPEEFFGLPMEAIARLERISSAEIQCIGAQRVLQYRESSLPLLSLEDCVHARPRPEAERLHVAVFRCAGREVGLVVPELLDIRRVPVRVDTQTFREPGISGSLLVDRMAVRLIDLHELVRGVHPDWFQLAEPVAAAADEAPMILVAEDSDFFRKQLVGYFEGEGYRVVGCEDGLVAWNTLQSRQHDIELVVTDIEMPNLDGLQLAERIRNDPNFERLPILAVSSLAGEDDIRRGQAVGVTEYHVKLDREQLVAAVAQHIKAARRSLAKV